MKLGKTEQKLIELARQRGGFYSIEAGGGRGSQGGRVSYGGREMQALRRLVNRGLATITSRQSDSQSNRGYTIRSTVVSFQLNEVQA